MTTLNDTSDKQRMTGSADPPYTRLTAAAGDPPDTNIVFCEYQTTSENLPELKGGKPAKTEAKKE